MIAGIGCKAGVGAADVLAAIDAALAAHNAARADLEALAVVPRKADEEGVAAAAEKLGLPLRVMEQAGEIATLTASERSFAATGQGSASEAAALAAAGQGGRLLGVRIAVGPVTCALSERGAP